MLKLLNNFQLKIIGIIVMTIDHIGYFFELVSLRIVGRITLPVFAFLISEGAIHTKNMKKYFTRLICFGIALELVYELGKYSFQIQINSPRNIFLTLAFGLLSIIVFRTQCLKYSKIPIIFLIALFAELANFDFGSYGILMILAFYVFRNRKLLIIFSLIILNIYYTILFNDTLQWFSLLALPIIFMYNNQKGKSMKYFFYFYYPIHLIIIYLIHELIR